MRRRVEVFGLGVLAITIAADLGLLGLVRRFHNILLADKLGHFALCGP